MKSLRLKAQQGDADAQFSLASKLEPDFVEEFLDSMRKSGNIDECVKWYRLAAEQGHNQAQIALGRIYSSTYWPKYEDKGGAHALFRLAANKGDAEAQYLLASELEPDFWEMDPDPKIIEECVKWYRLSAEQGHTLAQNALGGIHTNQTEEWAKYRDEREAIKWYEMAAEQGNNWAIGQVGDLYYSIAQKTGSQDEFKKARFWNKAALEEFYSRSETERFTDEYFWYLPRANNLITMYRKGLGGDVDQDEGDRFGDILNFLVLENERKSEYEDEVAGKLPEYENDLGDQADPGWSEDEQLK